MSCFVSLLCFSVWSISFLFPISLPFNSCYENGLTNVWPGLYLTPSYIAHFHMAEWWTSDASDGLAAELHVCRLLWLGLPLSLVLYASRISDCSGTVLHTILRLGLPRGLVFRMLATYWLATYMFQPGTPRATHGALQCPSVPCPHMYLVYKEASYRGGILSLFISDLPRFYLVPLATLLPVLADSNLVERRHWTTRGTWYALLDHGSYRTEARLLEPHTAERTRDDTSLTPAPWTTVRPRITTQARTLQS